MRGVLVCMGFLLLLFGSCGVRVCYVGLRRVWLHRCLLNRGPGRSPGGSILKGDFRGLPGPVAGNGERFGTLRGEVFLLLKFQRVARRSGADVFPRPGFSQNKIFDFITSGFTRGWPTQYPRRGRKKEYLGSHREKV